MTTALDSIFRPLAKSLLGQFGASAMLYRNDATATNDPTDAEVVPNALGPYSVKVSPPSSYKITRGDSDRGTGTNVGAFQCLIAATDSGLPSGVVPDRGWQLKDGTRIFYVEEVHPIKSGDLVTAYRLVLVGSGAP